MKNLKSRLIMFVLLVGLVFSGYKIVDYFYTSYDEKQNFNNVEKLVESEYEDEKIQYNDFEILKKYKKVYEKNNDLVGWIKIKDTNIDYPVMQTKDDYSYYLKRNFNKKSSIYGTPFVGEGCGINPNSDNVIIYGHNMKNGTMFADLNKYKDKKFYESHKEVQFDTLTEEGVLIAITWLNGCICSYKEQCCDSYQESTDHISKHVPFLGINTGKTNRFCVGTKAEDITSRFCVVKNNATHNCHYQEDHQTYRETFVRYNVTEPSVCRVTAQRPAYRLCLGED